MFEMEALFLEDIVLDMRDRIVFELTKVEERGMQLSPDFINEIEGKMEFSVRKIIDSSKEGQLTSPRKDINSSVVGNKDDLKWVWKEINDFDRLEKFSDDEVYEDEVIFKLVKKNGANEEVLDEKPSQYLEGYDCFSIYKHSDNSYEWRFCKIVGKVLMPEFRQQNAAVKALAQDKQFSEVEDFGQSQDSADDSLKYLYFLEFAHLKSYGREMWCKRRREDILFSSQYSREDQNFSKSCFKFILQNYKYWLN